MLLYRASEISFTDRTDTPAGYILMSASSMLLPRRRYRSMMAVSKEIPLSLDTFRMTSPEGVVRLRLHLVVTIFSDMVCCLLSNVCVASLFY